MFHRNHKIVWIVPPFALTYLVKITIHARSWIENKLLQLRTTWHSPLDGTTSSPNIRRMSSTWLERASQVILFLGIDNFDIEPVTLSRASTLRYGWLLHLYLESCRKLGRHCMYASPKKRFIRMQSLCIDNCVLGTGHYVPELAQQILNYNEKSTGFKINLKGFAVRWLPTSFLLFLQIKLRT